MPQETITERQNRVYSLAVLKSPTTVEWDGLNQDVDKNNLPTDECCADDGFSSLFPADRTPPVSAQVVSELGKFRFTASSGCGELVENWKPICH